MGPRVGADFLLVPWAEEEPARQYWIGLTRNVDSEGIASASQTMRYRDVNYTLLREVTVSALAGFQIAGDFGITWRESEDGKSWFLLHTEGLTSASLISGLVYRLVRLALNGASRERDFAFNAGHAYTGDSDLIIPDILTTRSGHHAAFAIGPDGHLWIPTHGGPKPINPDTGAMGTGVAWPLPINQYGAAPQWRLRGFAGSRAGLLVQVWYAHWELSAWIDLPDPPLEQRQDARAFDVRWRWYFLPWGEGTWELYAEESVTLLNSWKSVHYRNLTDPTLLKPAGYWQQGTDGTGLAPARQSMYDTFYDIGGCDPRHNLLLGIYWRRGAAEGGPAEHNARWGRDYQIGTGLALRPESATRQRRRPVRVGGKTWTIGAPFAGGVQTHERFRNISQPSSERIVAWEITFPHSAPRSQWRLPGQGPAIP